MVEGKVIQHQLTIPEGLTSEQIVARLHGEHILAGNIKEVPREGSLLPDTYHFNRGFTREQMIQRMQQAQRRLVQEIWERRNPDLPLKTPEQLVILASIIEKETGRAGRAHARRRRVRQPAQAEDEAAVGPDHHLRTGRRQGLARPSDHARARSQQPTPYNTYVIDGLPPGPIANPGRASLEAAANPARTKELFFVADGTGGHAFAETYEQHQKNVARLRVIEQEARRCLGEPPTQRRHRADAAASARAAPRPPEPRSAQAAGGSAARAIAAHASTETPGDRFSASVLRRKMR